MTKSRESGVTLLELMAVVVILGILAAVAIPSYRNYMLRAQRTDATAALLRVAAAQEKFYLQNNTYATDAQLDTAPPAGLGITKTEHGYYDLQITKDDNPTVDFVVTATARGDGPQAKDTPCVTFTIDQAGTRKAADGSNGDTTAICWR